MLISKFYKNDEGTPTECNISIIKLNPPIEDRRNIEAVYNFKFSFIF